MPGTFTPNGCGGKGEWVKPPQWIFYEDCCVHDTAYDKGGTEADRKAADDAFLRAMLESVRQCKSAWLRPFYFTQAYVYYRAVRWFGGKFFNYRTITVPVSQGDK